MAQSSTLHTVSIGDYRQPWELCHEAPEEGATQRVRPQALLPLLVHITPLFKLFFFFFLYLENDFELRDTGEAAQLIECFLSAQSPGFSLCHHMRLGTETTINLALRRQRQGDWNFKVFLHYIVSLRLA